MDVTNVFNDYLLIALYSLLWLVETSVSRLFLCCVSVISSDIYMIIKANKRHGFTEQIKYRPVCLDIFTSKVQNTTHGLGIELVK